MKRLEELRQLLECMEASRAESRHDKEAGHSNADSNLVTLARILARPNEQEIVDQILAAWGDTDKWYS